jgi:flagellar FliL protein
VIAFVLLGLIGGGVWAAFFFLGGDDEEQQAAAPGAAPAAGRGTATLENPIFLPIGTFVVNLADGRRYLKTNLELMLSEETAKVYLETRLAEVKDIVISELQVLNTEQLRDPRERANLKQRLLRSIESLLPNKNVEWDDPVPIKKVLITEFYLQ